MLIHPKFLWHCVDSATIELNDNCDDFNLGIEEERDPVEFEFYITLFVKSNQGDIG